MPLESFFLNENINIKDLAPNKEKEPVSESSKMYETLKDSLLYNKEKGLWKKGLDKNGKLTSELYGCYDQFLGVMAEAAFDKNAAKIKFEEFKNSLYDKENDMHNKVLDQDATILSAGDSKTYLAGILTESLFSKDSAEKRYSDFKESGFYDKATQQWIRFDLNQIEPEHDKRTSASQLLGILCEASLGDKESAQELYEALKKTELYNKEEKLWKNIINPDQTSYETVTFSEPQILGVLVEAQFDKDAAKQKFEELKAKPQFYYKSKKMWNRHPFRGERDASYCDTEAQLLGVLAENLFEKKQVRPENKLSLPENRKY